MESIKFMYMYNTLNQRIKQTNSYCFKANMEVDEKPIGIGSLIKNLMN